MMFAGPRNEKPPRRFNLLLPYTVKVLGIVVFLAQSPLLTVVRMSAHAGCALALPRCYLHVSNAASTGILARGLPW
jgi:hypothetical protein